LGKYYNFFMKLDTKKCVACEGKTLPLNKKQIKKYLQEINNWKLSSDFKKIKQEFKFKDFKQAIGFINKVAKLAEEEKHHPDIYIFYNRVKIELSTHAIKGLSENDFIMASKINKLIKSKF